MAKAIKTATEDLSAQTQPGEKKAEETTAPKATTLTDVFTGLYNGYGEHGTDVGKKEFCSSLCKYLTDSAFVKFPEYKKYNLIFLFDENTMVKSDADKIYNAVTKIHFKKAFTINSSFERGCSWICLLNRQAV